MTGRPKKPEEQLRANILRVRLTTAERAELETAANERGLETSTWARAELLRIARDESKRQKKNV
jgi:hypothetical protein